MSRSKEKRTSGKAPEGNRWGQYQPDPVLLRRQDLLVEAIGHLLAMAVPDGVRPGSPPTSKNTDVICHTSLPLAWNQRDRANELP
jgi:hypothetical protein